MENEKLEYKVNIHQDGHWNIIEFFRDLGIVAHGEGKEAFLETWAGLWNNNKMIAAEDDEARPSPSPTD